MLNIPAAPAGSVRPNHAFDPFPDAALEGSITSRFEKIAAQHENRTAIRDRRSALTYGDLNRQANRIAWAVLDRIGDANEPVGLLLDHGASVLLGIFGCLKAGKLYVPLDPRYPPAHNKFALQNSTAKALLTNAANLAQAKELAGDACAVLNVDDLPGALGERTPSLAIPPDAMSYIMHTSGTTGQPKGVVQTHRNVLHEVRAYTHAAHISAEDRMLLVSSCSFADSVRTIFGGLMNGALLYPFDVKAEGLGKLADWIEENGVTVWRSVATLFRNFASSLPQGRVLRNVRLLYMAGEPTSRQHAELFKQHFPEESVFVNGIGTSESFTFRMYMMNGRTAVEGDGVPCGYALPDKDVVLLNPEEGIGEIGVRSRTLSPGYCAAPT